VRLWTRLKGSVWLCLRVWCVTIVRFARDLPPSMLKRELRQFIISGSDELLYIPGFITEDEELYIFKKVKHSRLFACIRFSPT
jgi:hypothetical protein